VQTIVSHALTLGTCSEPSPTNEELDSLRIIQVLGDENSGRILTILHQADLSSEEKMRAIVRLDARFRGKTSDEWGVLLGITGSRVREFACWKELRQEKKRDW
jgi:hypothetical protein